jgi:hypothetical protein
MPQIILPKGLQGGKTPLSPRNYETIEHFAPECVMEFGLQRTRRPEPLIGMIYLTAGCRRNGILLRLNLIKRTTAGKLSVAPHNASVAALAIYDSFKWDEILLVESHSKPGPVLNVVAVAIKPDSLLISGLQSFIDFRRSRWPDTLERRHQAG